jgi:hypothetical protein
MNLLIFGIESSKDENVSTISSSHYHAETIIAPDRLESRNIIRVSHSLFDPVVLGVLESFISPVRGYIERLSNFNSRSGDRRNLDLKAHIIS